jgi:membrane protein CcdC involved in cytochrome C biogenesis
MCVVLYVSENEGRERFRDMTQVMQTAAVFYLLAFGVIVRWRLNMYRKYTAIAGRAGA